MAKYEDVIEKKRTDGKPDEQASLESKERQAAVRELSDDDLDQVVGGLTLPKLPIFF